MMLLAIGAVVWLALMLGLAAVCRMAARGDRAHTAAGEQAPGRAPKRRPGEGPSFRRPMLGIVAQELRRAPHPRRRPGRHGARRG